MLFQPTIVAFLVCAVSAAALAQPAATAPATQPATQPAPLPHIRVDRRDRRVDIDAVVVNRETEWIELLVCTPKSREHETILTSEARPSHIHLALLMLGLEPGSPLRWWREGDEIKSAAPRGPRLAVTLIYTKDGREIEVPAGEWIRNQKTGKPLGESEWLFAGSQTGALDDKNVYHADLNGTTISVVNFGDDLLTRPTEVTNMTDESTWGCNTDAIPPVDTKVTIRLRPVKDEGEAVK